VNELGRRERKKRETREALAAAALRLAVERGVENVSVEDISEAADVSVRTFFNYFSHKEYAILGRDPDAGERLLRRLREAPAELSPLAALRSAIEESLDDLERDAVAWSQRAALVAESPMLLARLVMAGADDERRLAAVLAERMGVDADDPAGRLTPLLLAAASGCAIRVALEHRGTTNDARPLRALVHEALDQLATGLDHGNPQGGVVRPEQRDQA
jgi:AcrR family transcriptional regulator